MYVRVIPLDGVELTRDIIKTAHIEAGKARRARFSADSFSSFVYKDGYRFHIRGAGADLCHVLVSAVESRSINKGHLLIRPYYTVGGYGYLRDISDVVDRPSSFTRESMTQHLAKPYTDALRFIYTKLPDLPPPSNIDTVPRVLHNEREARRFTDTYVIPKVYQMLKQNTMDREATGRAYPALDRLQRSRGFTKAFIYEATPLFLEEVYGDNSVPSAVISFIRIISLHIVDKILQVLDTFAFGKAVATYFKQVTRTYPSVMTVGGAYKRIKDRIAYCVREPDDDWMQKGVRTSYFYMDNIPVSVVNIGISWYAYEGPLQPGENKEPPGSIWLMGVPDEIPYDGTAMSELSVGFERFISCKVIEDDDDAGVLVYATQYTYRHLGIYSHADKTDDDDFVVRVYAFKIPISTNVLRNEPHYEFFGKRVTPPKKEWIFKRDKYPQLFLREGVLPLNDDPQRKIQGAPDVSAVLAEFTFKKNKSDYRGYMAYGHRHLVSDAPPIPYTPGIELRDKWPDWARVDIQDGRTRGVPPSGRLEFYPSYGAFVGHSYGIWASLVQSVFGFRFEHPREEGDSLEYAMTPAELHGKNKSNMYVNIVTAGVAFSTKHSVHIMNVLPIKFKGAYYLLPHRRFIMLRDYFSPPVPPPTVRRLTSVIFVAPKRDIPLRTGGSRTKLKAFDSGELAFPDNKQDTLHLTVHAHQALMLEAESTPIIKHKSSGTNNVRLEARSSMDVYRADIVETARSYGSGVSTSRDDIMAGMNNRPDDFRYGVYYSGFMHAQDIRERRNEHSALQFSSMWRYSYMFGMSPGVKKGVTFQLQCSGARDVTAATYGREFRGFVLPIYHDNWGTHIASKVHCTISTSSLPREEVVRSELTALEESGVQEPYAPIVESGAFTYDASMVSRVVPGKSETDESGFHRMYSYTANRHFKFDMHVDMSIPYQRYYDPTTTMGVTPSACFVGSRSQTKAIEFTDLQLTAFSAVGSAYIKVDEVKLDLALRSSLRYTAGGWRHATYPLEWDTVPVIKTTIRTREFKRFKKDDTERPHTIQLVNINGTTVGRSDGVGEDQADLYSRAANSYINVGVPPAPNSGIPKVLFCRDLKDVSNYEITHVHAPIIVTDNWAAVYAVLLGARLISLKADPTTGEMLDRIQDADKMDMKLYGQINDSFKEAGRPYRAGYTMKELRQAFESGKIIGVYDRKLYANVVRDLTGGLVYVGLSRGTVFSRGITPPYFPISATDYATLMRDPRSSEGSSSFSTTPMKDGADIKVPKEDAHFFVYVGDEEDPPPITESTYKRVMVSDDYIIQYTTEQRTIVTSSGFMFAFAYAVPAFYRQVLYNSPATMFDPFGVLYG